MGTMLKAAAHSHNYKQYALLLETGLRTAEMIGLTWDAIDWKKHTLIAEQAKKNVLSCTIWYSSTSEPESRQKIVPMIHTYTNYVMKQELNAFVCTPYDILMLHARLNAAYNLKFYSNY